MDQGGEYYRRYLHGDQDAFVSLVQMYMDGLVLFLTGITGDVTLAEDATEDTFVKLGVKRPHYSGKASFKTWLYTIGRNTARDHLRRYRRRSLCPQWLQTRYLKGLIRSTTISAKSGTAGSTMPWAI